MNGGLSQYARVLKSLPVPCLSDFDDEGKATEEAEIDQLLHEIETSKGSELCQN